MLSLILTSCYDGPPPFGRSTPPQGGGELLNKKLNLETTLSSPPFQGGVSEGRGGFFLPEYCWRSSTTCGVFDTNILLRRTTRLYLAASGSKGLMILISETSPGTYAIGGANSSALTLASYSEYTSSGVAAWQAPIDQSISDGQIVVTNSTETNFKGTFSFTATNSEDNSTVEVTNGKFNINY